MASSGTAATPPPGFRLLQEGSASILYEYEEGKGDKVNSDPHAQLLSMLPPEEKSKPASITTPSEWRLLSSDLREADDVAVAFAALLVLQG